MFIKYEFVDFLKELFIILYLRYVIKDFWFFCYIWSLIFIFRILKNLVIWRKFILRWYGIIWNLNDYKFVIFMNLTVKFEVFAISYIIMY